MNAISSHEDAIQSGISKILEGNALIEAEQKRLLSITVSTSEYLAAKGITEPTLRKRRNANLIPFIRVGKEYRYFLSEERGNHG